MRSFKNLKIIEQGMQIVSATHQLNTQFSQTDISGLIQEINLLAIGIPSIVAESSKQDGDAPYQQGLQKALHSVEHIENKLSAIEQAKPKTAPKAEGMTGWVYDAETDTYVAN